MRETTQALRKSLLRWYDVAARDLPWRRTRDPYAVWVSEVMLQQTRVETVGPYYERFLERFPTPYALAAAPEDAVMAAFSGLGYYRRARLLHAGVREVVARYGGVVPQDASARRALPGIGRYTAGAIGSIAFGLQEPIVDGNVARVLSRLFGIDAAPEQASTQRRLWEKAERLVQGPRPGALNQALMELGATLCSKQSARCGECPVRACCVAYAQDRVAELPRPRAKPLPRAVALVALLATRDQSDALELFLERGEGSLFAGLWNLPMTEGRGRKHALALKAQRTLDGRLAQQPAAELEHVLTHRRLQVQVWRVQQARSSNKSLRAVALRELEQLGISRLTRKALDALGTQERGACVRITPGGSSDRRRRYRAAQSRSS